MMSLCPKDLFKKIKTFFIFVKLRKIYEKFKFELFVWKMDQKMIMVFSHMS